MEYKDKLPENYKDLYTNTKNKIVTTQAATNIASVFGNVAWIGTEMIKSIFPTKFIRNVYSDNTLPEVFMDREIVDDITRRERPYMNVSPRLSISEDDNLSGQLPQWLHGTYYLNTLEDGYYTPVLVDPEHDIAVVSIPFRYKTTLSIDIVTRTRMEQINVAAYMKNTIRHKAPFYIKNKTIETEIPKAFVYKIAKMLGADIRTDIGRAILEEYLNKYSHHYITRKRKRSSGYDEYFYRYETNILTLLENYPEMDDGETKDMSFRDFKIRENLVLETWMPITYIMQYPEAYDKATDDTLPDYIPIPEGEFTGQYFNVTIPVHRLPYERNGKLYLRKSGYIIDEETVGNMDILDISSMFRAEEQEVIAFMQQIKKDITEVMEVVVFANEIELDPPLYDIDWVKLELTTLKPEKSYTYLVVIYVDRDKFNQMTNKLQSTKPDFYK